MERVRIPTAIDGPSPIHYATTPITSFASSTREAGDISIERRTVNVESARPGARLDEEELADWRAGRNAVYQLAALTIGARLAVADDGRRDCWRNFAVTLYILYLCAFRAARQMSHKPLYVQLHVDRKISPLRGRPNQP